jgi:photosystem II stability/assembly factor-like uncharacterized protein
MTKNIFFSISFMLLLKSSLFGQWTQLPNLSQNIISIYVSNNNLLAGTDSGTYYSSDNGDTWNTSSGISTTAKSFSKDGNKLLVSSYEKLLQSTNDGVSWSALPTIYTFQNVNNVLISNTNYLVGMNGSGVWFSEDKGSNWVQSSTTQQGPNSAIVTKKNKTFSSFQSSGYFQASNDNGQTWYSPSCNGIKTGMSSSFQDISCLAVKNDSILIAGTKNYGTASQYDGVYFSYDDGNNWTKKINGITTTAINSIEVIGNLIFIGTNGGGVFYSSDDGNNWTALNTGLSNSTINKLYINGSTLYAGVSTGLFKIDICYLIKNTSSLNANSSTTILSGDSVKLVANNNGLNYQWFLNNTLISSANNNEFFAKTNGKYKVVISYSSGCSDTSNTISIVVNSATKIIHTISLGNFLKLYPNPSNGIVTFEYTTPLYSEPFELLIYNVTGSLINTYYLSKNHEKLTISDWEEGVYFVLTRNQISTSQTQKIIVIK